MLAFEKSAGAVIFIRKNDKILFLLLKYAHGHWDFCKGKMEKGESEIETIKREAREETEIADLDIFPGFREKIYFYYTARGNEREKRLKEGKGVYIFKKVAFYIAETKTEIVNLHDNHEQTDYEWLTYENALERITYWQPRRLLKKVRKHLQVQEI